MPIPMVCPQCQSKLAVPDQAAGKRVKCLNCQTVLSVPKQDGAEQSPAKPKPKVVLAESADEEIRKKPVVEIAEDEDRPRRNRRDDDDDDDDRPRRKRRDEDDDDDDDRPRKKRKRKADKASGMNIARIITSSVVGLLLIVVLTITLIQRRSDDKENQRIREENERTIARNKRIEEEEKENNKIAKTKPTPATETKPVEQKPVDPTPQPQTQQAGTREAPVGWMTVDVPEYSCFFKKGASSITVQQKANSKLKGEDRVNKFSQHQMQEVGYTQFDKNVYQAVEMNPGKIFDEFREIIFDDYKKRLKGAAITIKDISQYKEFRIQEFYIENDKELYAVRLVIAYDSLFILIAGGVEALETDDYIQDFFSSFEPKPGAAKR